MFVGLHVMLAGATGVEELAITDDEGASFMAAAGKVARHYSVTTTQKTMDWIAFFGVAAAIYAPRVVALSRAKSATKKDDAPASQPATPWAVPTLVPNDHG